MHVSKHVCIKAQGIVVFTHSIHINFTGGCVFKCISYEISESELTVVGMKFKFVATKL